MNGLGGLFELVIAAIVLGWGFIELRNLRRDKRKAEEARKVEDGRSVGG